jgi:hypothetical protein
MQYIRLGNVAMLARVGCAAHVSTTSLALFALSVPVLFVAGLTVTSVPKSNVEDVVRPCAQIAFTVNVPTMSTLCRWEVEPA